ncbi:phospho-sugar mutase [Raineya orbicola]|jgi:phosphoglucomutase|uniref:Phosphomannomutase n=1 Tax=Raineya orbicola TaxID=2016530 RepID=A0A2N3I9X8_9BACT|nr:phospho-sugar mutase [Raineya orbicola]PKQ67043.1 Phosphomannomutase [Raineya orbicola]
MQERIQEWLSHTDTATRQAITEMQQTAPQELQEAFFQDLEFGTGGLRGIMGIGTNRMNKYTVGLATQGLTNYLKKTFPTPIKVAISYDSRNQSREFAQITADVFSANGVQVYMFQSLRPTPLLSFAIRHLGCQSGVMLTASHNPKEYNGYKAYWNDGSQLVKPHDEGVIAEVKKVKIQDINFSSQKNLISYLDETFDEIYLQEVAKLSLNPELNEKYTNLSIVYTALHGTGITLVPKVLQRFGFQNVHIVQEQAEPNGNFPTVIYPNPEEAEALTLALQKAKEINADLVLANDPDADRVGIAVRDLQGNFVLLNGNQTGVLLMYYLLTMWQKLGKLKGKEYIVKTIVTTELIDAIAEKFGVQCYNTYTGFKYIASVMRENESKATYIAGCEESYGYLVGDFVRDKDGISACAFIAEMTAYAQEHFGGLYAMLLHIYKEFGWYEDALVSLTKKGVAGMEEIKSMMNNFRQNPPKSLAGSPVAKVKDYQALTEKDWQNHTEKPLNFDEKSNVLQFFTADGTKISVRPSGTEPKIKFYFNLKTDFQENTEKIQQVLQEKIKAIRQDLGI